MLKKLKRIGGMNDLLPEKLVYWHFLEQTATQLFQQYAYEEIRFPVLEYTDLFHHSIGEATDIVEKEMYTFTDLNGERLSLRPEGTAGCARAVIENSLLRQKGIKLWYQGPMFRHETPQKGRFRQFHQIGAEIYGFSDAATEAELIALGRRLWQRLGINQVTLQINSLGSLTARQHYRAALISYFEQHLTQLDDISKHRLTRNPLRILDSKNPEMREVIKNAPIMVDYLDAASAQHFQQVLAYLEQLNIPYQLNPRLVRGLDYYNNTVFEWLTDQLGSQGAICSGGRYDGLTEHLGGPATPAVGMALGMERVILLLEQQNTPLAAVNPDFYFVLLGDKAQQMGLHLAEKLRDTWPMVKMSVNMEGGSIKSQMKRADRCQSRYALIIGDEEYLNQTVSLKNLRQAQEQQSMTVAQLFQNLGQFLKTE